MEDKEAEKEVNIKDLLKEIKEGLDNQKDKKTVKKFRLPFNSKVSKSNIKKGYVTVAYISQNKAIDFFKVLIDEGVYKDKNGIPHVATASYMMSYKGKPLIIQPEWSQVPFSPEKHLDETMSSKNSSTGWKLLANHFEKEQIKPKASIGGMGWIIAIIAIVAIGYFAYTQGYFQ